jgi:hypothetical protein
MDESSIIHSLQQTANAIKKRHIQRCRIDLNDTIERVKKFLQTNVSFVLFDGTRNLLVSTKTSRLFAIGRSCSIDQLQFHHMSSNAEKHH